MIIIMSIKYCGVMVYLKKNDYKWCDKKLINYEKNLLSSSIKDININGKSVLIVMKLLFIQIYNIEFIKMKV